MTTDKFRLVSAVVCAASALALLGVQRLGLWRQWGFDLAGWYITLGSIGLLYCIANFTVWLVQEQKTGKNYGDPQDPTHDKENHDGI